MGNLHLDLPDDLHKQLKITAIENETTLKDLVIERLEDRL